MSRTVIINARVRTLDGAVGVVEGLAVADGRVSAVGTREHVVAAAGADAAVVDARGATIMPALIDVHVHHNQAGEAVLRELQFPPTASVGEILDAVADRVVRTDEPWIVGGTWGSGLFAELSDPRALAALDGVSGDRPVLLADDSHHNRWANTAAMRLLGILDLAEDPEGGTIVRDARGRPTGMLVEEAASMAERLRAEGSPPDPAAAAEASAEAIRILHSYGITTFLDAAMSEPVMAGLKLLDDEGSLRARVLGSLLVNDPLFGTAKIGAPLLASAARYRTSRHRPDFVKIFLDGVPTSYTAAFLEPYRRTDAHPHPHHGGTTMTADELSAWFTTAAEQGLGIKVHCTGDASVRATLDAAERLRAAGFGQTLVHVAHTAFVHDDDLARFAELGVVAEISPFLWVPGVIPSELLRCIPPELDDAIHPNRALLDAGALLAAGSDWPVSESANPWHGIHGLVNRSDPTGRFPGALVEDEAISLDEAIAAFTTSAAKAIGLEDAVGRLVPGMSADFVVLDRDPYDVEPADLGNVRAVETWFEGERVFSAAALPGQRVDATA